MKIRTEKKLYKIEMFVWDGEQYGPDIFDDMETNFPRGKATNDDLQIIATDAETKALINWWEEAVEAANKGEDTDSFYGLNEYEIENGVEYVLSVEEAD